MRGVADEPAKQEPRQIAIWLSYDELEKIRRRVDATGMKRNAVIRAMIREAPEQ